MGKKKTALAACGGGIVVHIGEFIQEYINAVMRSLYYQ